MGFKIIRDFVKDQDEKGAEGIESVKPKHFMQSFIGTEMDDPIYEYNGGEIRVRLLDDDKSIHYHAMVDDDDFSCELLLTWGGRYSGATAVDMHIDNYRELFGEPRYEKFLSKCGKWYSYMG